MDHYIAGSTSGVCLCVVGIISEVDRPVAVGWVCWFQWHPRLVRADSFRYTENTVCLVGIGEQEIAGCTHMTSLV
jgi:hypothetical protein